MPYGRRRVNRRRKNLNRPRRMARKKGRYPKGNINRRPAALTLRGPTGIPDRMKMRLRYVQNVSIAPLAAHFQDYIFRGNSAFDPDFTGVGHQPYYFDQYSALYNKYRVYGSSIRVDVVNQSGVMATSVIVVPHSENTGLTSISQAAELQRARYPRIVPIAQRISVMLKEYASTRAVLGLTKPEMEADDIYAALTTTNPSSGWWWHVLMESVDGVTTLQVQLQVRITYYMEFFDPYLVGQS